LSLQQQDPERDIQLYINSPGGEVDAGLAVYDAMQLVQPKVAITCVGTAVGISSLLLAGGERDKRATLPNARMMIHQPSSEVEGIAADVDVQAREVLRLNARLIELLARDTGQSVERVAYDINRDYWMSAAEAMEYGVVGLIVGQTAATAAADRAEAAVKETSDGSSRPFNGKR